MFKKYLAIFTLALGLAGLVTFATNIGQTFAVGVNDFTITSFKSDQTLSRDDPQGELHIVEHIRVDFSAYNHGIERAIPEQYKGNNIKFHLNSVTSSTSAPTHVDTRRSNGNVILRIGDEDETVTGLQEYTIDYTLQNVITFYDGHDELYWDVNGDQWDQPTSSVQVKLNLPAELKLSSDQPVCYSGGYGGTSQNCSIFHAGNTVQASAYGLSPRQTLTYVVGFQKGYFTPMSSLEKLTQKALLWLAWLGPVLLGFVVGFGLWFMRGRDAKGRGVIVPQYEPPEGISPIQAGTIMDFKADSRDLTATLIDLARRNFIKIIEIKKKRLLGGEKLSYELELVNTDKDPLTSVEKDLLEALFASYENGAIFKTSIIVNNDLSRTVQAIRKDVVANLTDSGYFKPNAVYSKIASSMFTIGFVLLFISGALNNILGKYSTPLLLSAIGGLVILTIFLFAMPARTKKGTETKEQLEGLKMYMELAEKDRMEKLEGPNAAYADHDEPTHTVEFFEKLLPYAVAMGVEKQWSKQFENIYETPPSWYAGSNMTAFSAGYLAGSLNDSFVPAFNNNFSASSSSSSSGFGGGGFAGGGGGGGGGGGW